MSEWISAEDQLPEIGVGLLGYVRIDPEGAYDEDYEFIMHTGKGVFKHHRGGTFVALPRDMIVTHWMPLPEPPK